MTQEKETAIIQKCKEQMDGFSIHEVQVDKNNQKGLRGVRIGKAGDALGIVVYWDDIWQTLGEECTADSAVEYIQAQVEQYLMQSFSYKAVLDWRMATRRIHKKLVNYDRNKDRLEKRGIIHRRYLDLAEVCYLQVRLPAGNGTAEITKELLDIWGVSEEEVFARADQNLDRNKYYMADMDELLGKRRRPCMEQMYVVLNVNRSFGAAILSDPDLLKSVLGYRDADYYILPSSIHEVILCPAMQWVNAERLQEMVQEVNRTAVSEGDFLSDSVYYYHADTGTIEICREGAKE